MKVEELMTADPATCCPLDDLTTAGVRMWDRDCGVLPVIDGNKLVGVITDRDICMALIMRGAQPSVVTVGSVVGQQELATCHPEDDVLDALSLMASHQVRRLPVVADGRLEGILSIDDLVREARELGGADHYPTDGQVIRALQGICSAHRSPTAA